MTTKNAKQIKKPKKALQLSWKLPNKKRPSSLVQGVEQKRRMSDRSHSIRNVFVKRANRALSRLKNCDESLLMQAIEAPSDYGVLSFLLSQPEVLALPQVLDPLAGARMRGIEFKRQMIECEGGAKSTSEVADLLKVSPQAVNKKRALGKFISVELGKKGFYYPVWQFGLAGLEAALNAMPEADGWTRMNFFLNPNDGLDGERPLDVLRRDGAPLDLVVKAAEAFGEHGA